MKLLILYKSKHGSTKEYAEFIHRLTFDSTISNLEDFDEKKLADYDRIIVGSRTYMGNIEAVGFIEKNWEILKTKKVFLFAVGMQSADSEASKQSYEKIPEEIRKSIRYVKVPGRINWEDLKFLERLIMKSQDIKDMDQVNMIAIQSVLNFGLGI